MILQEVRRRLVRVELPVGYVVRREVVADALADARVPSRNHPKGDRLRQVVAVRLVDQAQVEDGVEQVFDVGVADARHLDPLHGRSVVGCHRLVDVFDALAVGRSHVHQHRQAGVVFAEQRHERGQVLRLADGDYHPARVELGAAVRRAYLPQNLQVDHVGRRVDQQAVRREEYRLRQLVAERRLQREHRLLAVLQNVLAHHRAEIVHVLDRADAREVVQVYHERRVGGVDDLMLGREALVDEAQEVVLGERVQVQPRLVEQDDHVVALLFLEVREVHEEAEEPHESLGALVERDGHPVAVVPDADVEYRPLIQRRRVVGVGDGQVELHAQLRVLLPEFEDFVADADGRRLQLRLQVLVIHLLLEVVHVRADHREQREEGAVGVRHVLQVFAPPLEVLYGDAPAHGAVVVEVNELRQAALQML